MDSFDICNKMEAWDLITVCNINVKKRQSVYKSMIPVGWNVMVVWNIRTYVINKKTV